MTEEQPKKRRAVPIFKLSNNQILPLVALSTNFQFNKYQMTQYFKKAFQYGYRHIDCSRNYGNQAIVGQALVQCIKQKRVKREEIFINTKTFNHISKNPVSQIKQALKIMNLQYFDLYCLQFPASGLDNQGYWTHRQIQDIWKDMQLCVEKGYTKHIGVCNFTGQAIQDLVSYAKIKPICNQIQLHPYLSQVGLVQICLKNNIQVFALSPLCPKQQISDVPLLKQQLILQLAQKYNRTPSQIIIKSIFTRQVGAIIQTQKLELLKQYYQSWNLELSEDDMKKIKQLNNNNRTLWYKQFFKDDIDIFE